jgi:hypothetical protein
MTSEEFRSKRNRINLIGIPCMLAISFLWFASIFLGLELTKKFLPIETTERRYLAAACIIVFFLLSCVLFYFSMKGIVLWIYARMGVKCPSCSDELTRRADAENTEATGICPACNQRLWAQID